MKSKREIKGVKKVSQIDDFMSKVVDLDEKEKEETILFLANALSWGKAIDFIGGISDKVMFLVLPFLTDGSRIYKK